MSLMFLENSFKDQLYLTIICAEDCKKFQNQLDMMLSSEKLCRQMIFTKDKGDWTGHFVIMKNKINWTSCKKLKRLE